MNKTVSFLILLTAIQFIVILSLFQEVNNRQETLEKTLQELIYLSDLKEKEESNEPVKDKHFIEQDIKSRMEQSVLDYILFKYKKEPKLVEVTSTIDWEKVHTLNDFNEQVKQNTSIFIEVHLVKGIFEEKERVEIANSLKRIEGLKEVKTKVLLIDENKK